MDELKYITKAFGIKVLFCRSREIIDLGSHFFLPTD